MINYLNRIRQRTVIIDHDGSGAGNPADYVIVGATIDDSVLADDYFTDKTSVIIVGMQLVNNHATDNLEYNFMSGGGFVFGESKKLLNLDDIQINGTTQPEMLGMLFRDGQGNYMMPLDAQNEFVIRITSASAAHSAVLHVQFLIEE